jgi:hypothetical protein
LRPRLVGRVFPTRSACACKPVTNACYGYTIRRNPAPRNSPRRKIRSGPMPPCGIASGAVLQRRSSFLTRGQRALKRELLRDPVSLEPDQQLHGHHTASVQQSWNVRWLFCAKPQSSSRLGPTLVIASATQLASTTAVSVVARRASTLLLGCSDGVPLGMWVDVFQRGLCWLVVGPPSQKPIPYLAYQVFSDLAVSETAKRDASIFSPLHLQRIQGGHRFPLSNLL